MNGSDTNYQKIRVDSLSWRNLKTCLRFLCLQLKVQSEKWGMLSLEIDAKWSANVFKNISLLAKPMLDFPLGFENTDISCGATTVSLN